MSIRQSVCVSFLVELYSGVHDFTSDTFRIALYTDSATLNEDTTAYTATGEVGSGSEARGALIYNTSKANRAVMVLDFGRYKTVGSYSAGGDVVTPVTPFADGTTAIVDFDDLTVAGVPVTFPSADRLNAILRITA